MDAIRQETAPDRRADPGTAIDTGELMVLLGGLLGLGGMRTFESVRGKA